MGLRSIIGQWIGNLSEFFALGRKVCRFGA